MVSICQRVYLSGKASTLEAVRHATCFARQHGTRSKLLRISQRFASRAPRSRNRAARSEESRTRRAALQPQRSPPLLAFFPDGRSRRGATVGAVTKFAVSLVMGEYTAKTPNAVESRRGRGITAGLALDILYYVYYHYYASTVGCYDSYNGIKKTVQV